MFISICRRDSEVVEVVAWVEEEVLEEGGDEVEDIMVAQEDIYSTIQPISKITIDLMYTFIRRRPPTQPVSTTICDGFLGTDKPINQ
jgi:hypothetical protein